MDVYLVRHGESTNNRGDSPVPYPPLTELGKEQARRAGEFLKSAGITHLYSSPMLRALETAAFISAAIGQLPHVLIELCEWGGDWSGAQGETRSQILEACPNAILPDTITEEGWWFLNETRDAQEAYRLVCAFAETVVALLRERHVPNSDCVGLVSHGGSGDALIGTLLGIPPTTEHVRFSENNTGITRFQILSGRTGVLYMNRVDHLLPHMVT